MGIDFSLWNVVHTMKKIRSKKAISAIDPDWTSGVDLSVLRLILLFRVKDANYQSIVGYLRIKDV
jgi:hypothetical protein